MIFPLNSAERTVEENIECLFFGHIPVNTNNKWQLTENYSALYQALYKRFTLMNPRTYSTKEVLLSQFYRIGN